MIKVNIPSNKVRDNKIGEVDAFLARTDNDDVILFLKDDDGNYFVGFDDNTHQPIVMDVQNDYHSDIQKFLNKNYDDFTFLEIIDYKSVVIDISIIKK